LINADPPRMKNTVLANKRYRVQFFCNSLRTNYLRL
jgi:hypothetical protein